jgi:hypothetical protein
LSIKFVGRAAEQAVLARLLIRPDLGTQRVQRRRVAGVERIAEHTGRHADLAEPRGYRLGLVRSVIGIPAAGQDIPGDSG